MRRRSCLSGGWVVLVCLCLALGAPGLSARAASPVVPADVEHGLSALSDARLAEAHGDFQRALQ